MRTGGIAQQGKPQKCAGAQKTLGRYPGKERSRQALSNYSPPTAKFGRLLTG